MVGPVHLLRPVGPRAASGGHGIDVRPHPHINLATVTYLFDGAIEHRDSIGTFQRIEPGAINLMTAGRGIVHSERSPASAARRRARASTACRPGSLLPDGERGGRSGVRACPRRRPCRWSRATARGAGADGDVVGPRLAGRPAAFADHLCRHRSGAGGRGCRSTPRPTSGRVTLVEGDAALDGSTARRRSPSTFCGPGIAAACDVGKRRAADAVAAARRSDGPRHVFWNFVSSSRDRINQAKEDWKARRLPAVRRRRPRRIHPAARSADDGQLSVTEFRRVALSHRRHAQRRAGRDPARCAAVILLHGFPESHRTWREVAPRLEDKFRLIMPDQRGFAGSDQPHDVDGIYRPTSWSMTFSRWPMRSASRASRWLGTIGAERSPGRRRCAATRA